MIAKDKIKHLLVCTAISFVSTEAAIGAALGKEYGDSKAKNNRWDWYDILWDTIGIAIGTVTRIAVNGSYYWF